MVYWQSPGTRSPSYSEWKSHTEQLVLSRGHWYMIITYRNEDVVDIDLNIDVHINDILSTFSVMYKSEPYGIHYSVISYLFLQWIAAGGQFVALAYKKTKQLVSEDKHCC